MRRVFDLLRLLQTDKAVVAHSCVFTGNALGAYFLTRYEQHCQKPVYPVMPGFPVYPGQYQHQHKPKGGQ